MAFELSAVAAKDGASATVGGGLLAGDKGGGGTGPFFLFQGIVDGVAGVNRAQVDASNQLVVTDGPAVTTLAAIETALTSGLTVSDPTVLSQLNDMETDLESILTGIIGDVAHGDNEAGNPAKIGGRTKAGLSGVTVLAADKRTDAYFTTNGAQYVREIPLEDLVDGTASNTDGTSTLVIAAPGSGLKTYLTYVDLSNNSGAGVMVALKSVTTNSPAVGTTRWRVYVPAGGRRLDFSASPLKPNGDNETWHFDPDSATSTIECSMIGFKSKV